MFDNSKLGLNDEELDDYRDFDDEHSEQGSKLDDFGADEDDECQRQRAENEQLATGLLGHAPGIRK